MDHKKVVVLGTGGTIAGRASHHNDNVGYRAAELAVTDLVTAVPGLQSLLGSHPLECAQLVQVDSKDMEWDVWQSLGRACERYLADDTVHAVIVTHGTDTLEETAYFLHLALADRVHHKPIVLTCAMRPATSVLSDGPQNLLDAVAVALDARSRGVMAVCAGVVHSACHLQKFHPYRVDAFTSGDAGPLACVEEGGVRWLQRPAAGDDEDLSSLMWGGFGQHDAPLVDIVMHYAGAGDRQVDALCAMHGQGVSPPRGIVVAGTGNGTVNSRMALALQAAAKTGVAVVIASRCAVGGVVRQGPSPEGCRVYPGLSAVKARIRLMLTLLKSDAASDAVRA